MASVKSTRVDRPSKEEETEEYGHRIRALIRHENDLANHRTTWLLVIQALLVAATSNFMKDFSEIVLGLSIVGILVAYSIGDTLSASLRSRIALKQMWSQRLAARGLTLEQMLPVDGGFAAGPVRVWLLPGQFLPKLIIVAWAVLALYVAFRRWT